MKKNSKIINILVAVLALFGLVGCTTTVPTTKSVDPTTQSSATTKSEESTTQSTEPTTQSTESTQLVDYAKPTITYASSKLTFSSTQATSFEIKVDGATEWAEASEHELLKTVGTHTVVVRVKANDAKSQEEETYTYETKAVSLTLTADTLTHVSIEYVGTELKYYNGTDFVATTLTEYTATESCTLVLRAFGGYDETNKVLYALPEASEANGYVEAKCVLSISATGVYTLEDATGKSATDLADDWVSKKYDNGWVNSSAAMSVSKHFNDDCVRLTYWDNYATYKYSKSYSVTDAYNLIALDLYGNGNTTIKVQLASSKDGVYATYSLGKAAAQWESYVISLNDSSWKLNYGGNDYSLDQVKSYFGMSDAAQFIQYFDTISILCYGESSNGASACSFFDNLVFGYDSTEFTSSHKQELKKTCSVYTAENSVGTVFKLSFTNVQCSAATLETLNLETNLSVSLSCEPVAYGVFLFKDTASSGSALTFKAELTKNGAIATIKEESGTYASQVSGLAFTGIQDVTSLVTSASFHVERYTDNATDNAPIGATKWKVLEGAEVGAVLGVDDASGLPKIMAPNNEGTVKIFSSLVVNDATYPAGIGKKALITIKNLSDATVNIKVFFVKVAFKNTESLRNAYASYCVSKEIAVPAGAGFQTFEVDFGSEATIYSIYFSVANSWGNGRAVAIKSIEIVGADPNAEYVAPAPETDTLTKSVKVLDFEDGAGSDKYTNANWKQEKYTTTWETVTGRMNSRNNLSSTSKIVNFAAGYGYTYRFTYAENNGTTSLGTAKAISLDLGNYYNGGQDIKVKVKVVYYDGAQKEKFVMGDSNTYVTIPVGTGFVNTGKLEFGAELDVRAIVVVVNGSKNGDQFLYCDNITLWTEEEQPTEYKVDFESAIANSAWKTEKYESGWVTITAQVMYDKTDKTNYKSLVNGYYTPRQFTFAVNEGTTSLGTWNHLSIDLGNWYASGGDTLEVKVYVIDSQGNKHYAVGSSSAAQSIAYQAGSGFTTYEGSFDSCDVRAVVIWSKSPVNGNAYLYMDNIVLSNVQPE